MIQFYRLVAVVYRLLCLSKLKRNSTRSLLIQSQSQYFPLQILAVNYNEVCVCVCARACRCVRARAGEIISQFHSSILQQQTKPNEKKKTTTNTGIKERY